jgi:hypothetical protein
MVYVPIGYANADISLLQEVNGGSPWGASTIAAGDGSRLPTQIELGVARYQVSTPIRTRCTRFVLLLFAHFLANLFFGGGRTGQVLFRVRRHPTQGQELVSLPPVSRMR